MGSDVTGDRQAAGPATGTRRALVLVSLLWLGMLPFLSQPSPSEAVPATHAWLLGLALATLGVALGLRSWDVTHVPLLTVLYLAAYCLPVLGTWPLALLVVLAGYGAYLASFPRARQTARFWRRGTLDRTAVAWMVLFSAAAAIALVAWRFGASVDMARYRHFVPAGFPTWALFVGVVPLAIINAFFEELMCRGIVWQACEEAFGGFAALIVTSLGFGLWHYRGFPSGMLGIALATVYGLMMGLVRMRTRGLLGPFVAHVLADVVIYTMVVAMVVGA
jgi:membrane protease YdiL (CAAX protease family)